MGHIVGGLLIFRRTSNVRRRGQDLKVLLRTRPAGDVEEFLVPLVLLAEITEAENLAGRNFRWLLGKRREDENR